MARRRIILALVLAGGGLIGIPVAMILLAGVAAGLPLRAPLSGMADPAAMGLLIVAAVVAIVTLPPRSQPALQ